MEPLIPKGSQVTLKSVTKLKDGDIVYYEVIKTEDTRIRKCVQIGKDKWAFIAIDSNFETETLTTKEFTVLGKAFQKINRL